ncbi:MAG: hypothetical protein ACYDA3_04770 [Gaiellaceae bacterium]
MKWSSPAIVLAAVLAGAVPAAADSTKEVIVANTAQNPVPVSFQQSAPWLVTFVGQPTVALLAGTSVGLDPAANTVKLDPGANTVQLAPAQTVQVVNAPADTLITRDVRDGTIVIPPAPTMDLALCFGASDVALKTLYHVPDGKVFMLESVSLAVGIPMGEHVIATLWALRGGEGDALVYVPLFEQPFRDTSHFSNTLSTTVAIGGDRDVKVQFYRDSKVGTGCGVVSISGRLVDP